MYKRKDVLLKIYSIMSPLMFKNNLMEITNASIFVTVMIILSHFLLPDKQNGNGCNTFLTRSLCYFRSFIIIPSH